MVEKIKSYIKIWQKRCYVNGLPDEAPEEISDKVPSYKRIAWAILSNDHALESLGYTPKKSKVYTALKKIELKERELNYKKT